MHGVTSRLTMTRPLADGCTHTLTIEVPDSKAFDAYQAFIDHVAGKPDEETMRQRRVIWRDIRNAARAREAAKSKTGGKKK